MSLKSRAFIVSGRVIYVLLLPFFAVRPSTRTRGLVINEDNQILLVKNWVGNNVWDMPGGGVQAHEAPSACLSRELYEETGLRINKNTWAPLTERRAYATTYVYFIGKIKHQKPRCQKIEITDAAWFDLDALPPNRHAFLDTILAASMK